MTSKLTLTEDVKLSALELKLDIGHTWKGDLVVSVTSPSGKTVTVADRKGGSADDIVGRFDLSAFEGESAKGEWTLTVSDKARRDTGTLRGWGLTGLAEVAAPPIETEPPTGPKPLTGDPVVVVLDGGVEATHEDLDGAMWKNLHEIAGDGIDNDNNGFLDDVHGINLAEVNGDVDAGRRHRPRHPRGGHHRRRGQRRRQHRRRRGQGEDHGHRRDVRGRRLHHQLRDGRGLHGRAEVEGREHPRGQRELRRGRAQLPASSSAGARRPGGCWTRTSSSWRPPPTATAATWTRSPAIVRRTRTSRTWSSSPSLDRKQEKLANFSSYGPKTVDLAAPGEDIVSTIPRGKWDEMSGTSMATPHVAAAAALMFAANPDLTATQAAALLLKTAVKDSDLEGKVLTGGKLDVKAAVKAAEALKPRDADAERVVTWS